MKRIHGLILLKIADIYLIEAVTEAFNLSSQQLTSRSRRRPIVDARSVFAKVAVRDHGYKGTEVAKALSMSPPSVSRLVKNGEDILLCRETVPSDKNSRFFVSD